MRCYTADIDGRNFLNILKFQETRGHVNHYDIQKTEVANKTFHDYCGRKLLPTLK